MNDLNESGPLRHFRIGRRAVLQSLAGGVGAAVISTNTLAAHVHTVAAAEGTAAAPALAAGTHVFLDDHAFETLSLLSEQIVPGSRAVQVPEFLDRLLAVESTETQKRFISALGNFEREARDAQGKPWKALTPEQANAVLTKISTQRDGEPSRRAFDGIKAAVAETYYSSEAGKVELGWNHNVAYAPPSACP